MSEQWRNIEYMFNLIGDDRAEVAGLVERMVLSVRAENRAAALRISRNWAMSLLYYARAMRLRLPKVGALLRAGDLSYAMFRIPAADLATSLNQMTERTMMATLADEQPAVPHDLLVDTLAHIWVSAIYDSAT